ncbi:dephospho-CoA kinase [Alteromonas aestuariivivens]|uniref:Dephospho-CoA kinase n=2 Tax=Alteromonas aestuariivivens TaxID=1938339 RepID=A0A3D8MF35_9ALTE|nr:dephospho-CoA kinase [Alteromonas aestuariivivens]
MSATGQRPYVVGLTGGIGSGKTAVSDKFAELGIDIIDADIIARQVVEPGTPALKAITEHFGAAVIDADGRLDRAALRQRIFSDEQRRQWLNKLLHPAIRLAMQEAIHQSRSPYCILAVPLLIENGLDGMVNRVLVVDCPEHIQLERALARDGSTEQTIRGIMASQASREQRLAKADDVIDNSGPLSAIAPQVLKLHQAYIEFSARL